MFKRFIYHLRQKPKAARDRFAFGVAFTVTAMVATVWLYHAPAKFQSVLSERDDTTESSQSFFQMFDKVGSQLGAVKESMSNITATSSPDADNEERQSNDDFMIENNPTTTTASNTLSVPTSSAATTAPASADEPRVVRIITTSQATASASTSQSEQ